MFQWLISVHMQTPKCAIPEQIQAGNPGNFTSILIDPWKFHMLFLWYPWKFHFLDLPCLVFFSGIAHLPTLPLEILEKAKLHFWIFYKVLWHTLEIPKQNTKIDGNSIWFFLNHCWKFRFFFNWPVEFQHALPLIHLKILYPQSPALPSRVFSVPQISQKFPHYPPSGKIPPVDPPPQ